MKTIKLTESDLKRIVKRVLTEQSTGKTIISGLQLNNANVKKEGMYVKVSFTLDDIVETTSTSELNSSGGGNGTCDILLFMKNGKINYSTAYCVSEDGRDYPEMQKFVEFRLDLPAKADHNNFSDNILKLFGVN